MNTTIRRLGAVAIGMAGAVGVLAASAAAHVTVVPGEAAAGGYATLSFQVPHGCDGSATKALRVQIPESVPSATPQVHPGWEITTEEGPKDPVELHGEKVERGISEIAWTAAEADPLPDGRLDVFGVSVKLPDGEVGDPVYFPVVQECEKGTTAWIQIPAPDAGDEELEEPAPAVVLTASAGDGHGAADEAESAGDSTAEDDSDSDLALWLAIAAIVASLAALGVAVSARRGGRA